MRKTISGSHHLAGSLALILLAFMLWGCAEEPRKKTSEPVAPLPEKPEPVQEQGISLALPPSSYSAAFTSAEQALAGFDWMQASVALQAIPEDGLSQNDRTYLAYLQARISYVRGDQGQALAQLEQLQSSGIHTALRYRILSFKLHIMEIQGDALASAQLADQLVRVASRDTVAAWKRNVWRNLERADQKQLAAALPGATDPQWRGWLELALINREENASLPDQVSRWRINHPDHPAAMPLPGGLEYLGRKSGKVALILPLSGELAAAGKAVLNGYLAAYYADRATSGGGNDLLVLDQDKYSSASSAYDEAVRQGATMVVGPLSKEAVAEMATQLERPVPVLALNRIEGDLPAASGSALVQLSLAPEDEAVSVAELAFGTGARRGLIISPAGEWGDKMETAVRERWTALGGTIANSTRYSNYDDYSASVKTALSLDASELRARELRTLLGTDIDIGPHRREDVDVVFLLSRNGPEARSIKPLLAFHYAGSLPVYATSSIYNGDPDERNQDLNGIHLVVPPWLLGANPDLRATLAAGNSGASNAQLNALGADAFLVQSGFNRLQAGADALFRGNTGMLSMDPNLRIQRELSAATFDGGELKAP